MSTNYINLIGLIYDAAGAFLLGRAVVFNSKEKIAQQVMTSWDYNKQLIGPIVEGRIDAVVGLALLIVGFGFQALSQFVEGDTFYFAVLIAVLLAVFVIYRVSLERMVEKQTSRVLSFIEDLLRREQ